MDNIGGTGRKNPFSGIGWSSVKKNSIKRTKNPDLASRDEADLERIKGIFEEISSVEEKLKTALSSTLEKLENLKGRIEVTPGYTKVSDGKSTAPDSEEDTSFQSEKGVRESFSTSNISEDIGDSSLEERSSRASSSRESFSESIQEINSTIEEFEKKSKINC